MAARYPDLIDTHAHVTSLEFDSDRDPVIARAAELGVGFIEVGFDVASSMRSVEIAATAAVAAAVGIHPHNAADCAGNLEGAWKDIEALAAARSKPGDEGGARSGRVVAVGEIGLDYYRDLSPRDLQARCFEMGLDLAGKTRLPVIIHQRDAEEDTLAILKGCGAGVPAVFHCFGGGVDYARRCLDLGGWLGFGGTLTYPRNTGLRDLLRFVPLDRILLETDAPYLAPQSRRGRRNEPSYILETLETLAASCDLDVFRAGNLTRDNAVRAFGL